MGETESSLLFVGIQWRTTSTDTVTVTVNTSPLESGQQSVIKYCSVSHQQSTYRPIYFSSTMQLEECEKSTHSLKEFSLKTYVHDRPSQIETATRPRLYTVLAAEAAIPIASKITFLHAFSDQTRSFP
jgi:hypothetical protein